MSSASASSAATGSVAAAASSTGLPAGISKPLENITDTDKGGLIAILAAFALTLVLVSFPIRTYVRSKIGTYKMDDYAFIGATVSIVSMLPARTFTDNFSCLQSFKRLACFLSYGKGLAKRRILSVSMIFHTCRRFVARTVLGSFC
jgi:hypothetical protein